MKDLLHFFNPESIAVVGASNDTKKVGGQIVKNLLADGFSPDYIYPINTKETQIQGIDSFCNLNQLSITVDLVVIAVPAKFVPKTMIECGIAGVKNVIIISAGFGEAGKVGKLLQQQVKETAELYGIQYIGDNCLGVIAPHNDLNASFADSGLRSGKVSVVSQSGAICTGILDYCEEKELGLANVVSLGAAVNVDFGELFSYFAKDTQTESVVAYIEAVRDGKAFIQGLKDLSKAGKKVVLVKAGRSDTGAIAAASHTGALTSSDKVFDVAIRIPGVTRVYSIGDLLIAVDVLSRGYNVVGNRLAIVTNAGGPGVLAVDYCDEVGVPLAKLSIDTINELNEVLPPCWSKTNPIDVLGDAGEARYLDAVTECIYDDNVDGILVILTPQAMTDAWAIADTLSTLRLSKKPILFSFIGGQAVQEGRKVLNYIDVSHFNTPEEAIRGFKILTDVGKYIEVGYYLGYNYFHDSVPLVEGLISDKSGVLSTSVSKSILQLFDINVAETINVTNVHQALKAADAIEYPVVMKVNMPEFSHKSDIGGVILNINTDSEVIDAFVRLDSAVRSLEPSVIDVTISVEPMVTMPNGRELLIGVVKDPIFGHVISFGLGGTMVEVLADSALAMTPLTYTDIEHLVNSTKAGKYIKQFRNLPACNFGVLIGVFNKISALVTLIPQIKELDINPLLLDDKGAIALDARIVLE